MDYVLSAERQPKSVGFDSLRDEKGQSVRNIRRNMRQILQVKHYKMGEKISCCLVSSCFHENGFDTTGTLPKKERRNRQLLQDELGE